MRIALVGKMGAGKSLAAEYLVKRYNFNEMAFADPLKALCADLFPDLVGKQKPRKLYQTVGQFMREIDPNVWVNQLMKRITLMDPEDNILVTDIRQINEYIALKREGFHVIRVHADDDIRWKRCVERGDDFTEEEFNHETETAINSIPFDFLLTNNTSQEDLFSKLDKVMKWVGVDGSSQDRQTSE